MYTPDTVRHEIRGRLNGGVQMSHIVVYSIANRMYMAEYTSLEHAEQKIEEIKKPECDEYQLYETKLVRQHDRIGFDNKPKESWD